MALSLSTGLTSGRIMRNTANLHVGRRQAHSVWLGQRSRRNIHEPTLRTRLVARAEADDAADRLAEVEALQEAMQLYQQAQALSQAQVLAELRQMELSDMAFYQEHTDVTSAQSPAAPAPSSTAKTPARPAPARSEPVPGSIRRVPTTTAAIKPLQSFWLEQGLQPRDAATIAQEMVATGSPYCNLMLLEAQVQRLGRIIPDRMQDMLARDWRILNASPGVVAAHYVQLVQLFPPHLDVQELAARQPKLLYCEDLVGQVSAVVDKLTALHPSHNKQEAQELLVEYPDLVFRMPYYMHATSLDELPMELQNMMVYTSQGLQHLHQMHSDSISPKFL